jgi:hypothetical protein
MLYEINFNGKGLVPVSTEGKNDLPVGTILQMNGYSDPRFVIVANQGTTERFAAYGSRYETVNLGDMTISQHDAHSLKHISEKQDNRIAVYITDEILPTDEIIKLHTQAIEKQNKLQKDADKRAQMVQDARERGKAALNPPPWAKAVIVAYKEHDECDSMTDYFATSKGETWILAWSKHTKDLFPEMRKAATNSGMEEIAHLGIGKGRFIPRVIIGQSFQDNGSYYHQGGYSHWHHELDYTENHSPYVFTTRKEAEAFIADKTPEPISFDGQVIPFVWEIGEQDIEHREKYSMGSGYYLKAENAYGTGWKVEKMNLKYNMDDLYLAAGQGRDLTK